MRGKTIGKLILGALLAAMPGLARAQTGQPGSSATTAAQAAQSATAATPAAAVETKVDVRTLVMADLKDTQEKFVSLAKAIPADKFTWKPVDGVRSVAEILGHVTNTNLLTPRLWNVPPPPKQSWDPSFAANKDKTVRLLNVSFMFLDAAMQRVSDADLAKQVDFHGTQKTIGSALLQHDAGIHEHLGQLIAYARMMGVTPPWSATEKPEADAKTANPPPQKP